jgi:WD40 repeat protein
MPLAVSPDGQLLAAVSAGGTVKVWKVAALRRQNSPVEPQLDSR